VGVTVRARDRMRAGIIRVCLSADKISRITRASNQAHNVKNSNSNSNSEDRQTGITSPLTHGPRSPRHQKSAKEKSNPPSNNFSPVLNLKGSKTSKNQQDAHKKKLAKCYDQTGARSQDLVRVKDT
jgi:flagellar hook-basal body complex protein FliE